MPSFILPIWKFLSIKEWQDLILNSESNSTRNINVENKSFLPHSTHTHATVTYSDVSPSSTKPHASETNSLCSLIASILLTQPNKSSAAIKCPKYSFEFIAITWTQHTTALHLRRVRVELASSSMLPVPRFVVGGPHHRRQPATYWPKSALEAMPMGLIAMQIKTLCSITSCCEIQERYSRLAF